MKERLSLTLKLQLAPNIKNINHYLYFLSIKTNQLNINNKL